MCLKPQVSLKFSARSTIREETMFNVLHKYATCKLGQLARAVSKIRFSFVGSPGETKLPFNPLRVLLEEFSVVLHRRQFSLLIQPLTAFTELGYGKRDFAFQDGESRQ